MKKILIIPEMYGPHISGCGWIRLIHPYSQFSTMDDFSLRVGSWDAIKSWMPDVVVTQRIVANLNNLKNLEGCLQKGIKLIFDLDDDLLNIPSEHPDFLHYQDFKDPIQQFIESASRVTISTHHLVKMLGLEKNPNVEVIENEISHEHWFGNPSQLVSREGYRCQLVYFGTSSHQNDWKMIEEPTLDWLSDNADAKLTLIGVTDREYRLNNRIRNVSPPETVRSSYPAFVSWVRSLNQFDIGLAPLIDTNFNRAKSGLKVLEYSALGLVSVASSLDPYLSFGENLSSLVLSLNDEQSWYGSLNRSRILREKLSCESIQLEVQEFGTIAQKSSSQKKLANLISELI